jgi:hypothetical protein
MELNYNWATVDSLANLASRLPRRKREKIGRSQQSSRDDQDMSSFNTPGSHPMISEG